MATTSSATTASPARRSAWCRRSCTRICSRRHGGQSGSDGGGSGARRTTTPAGLADWRLALKNGGGELEYTFDASESRADIASLLRRMGELGIVYKDLN